jgi:hypothetical protein
MVLKDRINEVSVLCKGIVPMASFLGILSVESHFNKGE